MKINRQKRAVAKQKRLERTLTLQEQLERVGDDNAARRELLERALKEGVVAIADRHVLAAHNATAYELLPSFYRNLSCTCATCGAPYVWTAKQQKWWYEVALGAIYCGASGCASCRRKRRETRAADPFHVRAASIRALALQPPDAPARQVVEDALASKWTGLRVLAVAVLGAWWGRNRDAGDWQRLKAWVAQGATEPANSWPGLASASAAKALATHMGASDVAWALPELLLDSPLKLPTVRHVVDAMPREALLRELQAPKWMNAAHQDVERAPRMLDVLERLSALETATDWVALARHYIASPLIGRKAFQRLSWRVERLPVAETKE